MDGTNLNFEDNFDETMEHHNSRLAMSPAGDYLDSEGIPDLQGFYDQALMDYMNAHHFQRDFEESHTDVIDQETCLQSELVSNDPGNPLDFPTDQLPSTACDPHPNPQRPKVSKQPGKTRIIIGSDEDVVPIAKPTFNCTPDPALNTPAACRSFLAQNAITDCHKLKIEGDDLAAVEALKDKYIKFIAAAILEDFAHVPPYVTPITKPGMLHDFKNQQQAKFNEVKTRMHETDTQRAIKAQAVLLFEEAINIHKYGVKDDVYDSYLKAAGKSSRATVTKCEVDYGLKCSDRMSFIAKAIRCNKLVALDVLKGQHIRELAQNPRNVLKTKADYFKSNWTRKKNSDTVKEKLKVAEQAARDAETPEAEVANAELAEASLAANIQAATVTGLGKKKRAPKKRKFDGSPEEDVNPLNGRTDDMDAPAGITTAPRPRKRRAIGTHTQATQAGAEFGFQPTPQSVTNEVPFPEYDNLRPTRAAPHLLKKFAVNTHSQSTQAVASFGNHPTPQSFTNEANSPEPYGPPRHMQAARSGASFNSPQAPLTSTRTLTPNPATHPTFAAAPPLGNVHDNPNLNNQPAAHPHYQLNQFGEGQMGNYVNQAPRYPSYLFNNDMMTPESVSSPRGEGSMYNIHGHSALTPPSSDDKRLSDDTIDPILLTGTCLSESAGDDNDARVSTLGDLFN